MDISLGWSHRAGPNLSLLERVSCMNVVLKFNLVKLRNFHNLSIGFLSVRMIVVLIILFSFCRLSKPVTSLPFVSEVFPTLRAALEALNVRFTEDDCKNLPSF